jgi:hypothetical protein
MYRHCKEYTVFLPELVEKISIFIEATLFINKSARKYKNVEQSLLIITYMYIFNDTGHLLA